MLSAPALLHIVVFLVLPTAMVVGLSFTDYSFTGAYQWIGAANYQELWADQHFRTALVNTLLYTIVTVPFAMALALLIALGVNIPMRGQAFLRVAFYLPQVTATVAIATVWLWIYQPDVGLANSALSLFGFGPVPWLTSTDTALPALILVGVWHGLGAKMVVYLAALQSVNRELIEAAQLDGAGRWQVFRHVTWPALAPAQFFVLVTSVIASFQVFELVYVMTKGGPADSTTVLTYDVYKNAFAGLRLGYASAESVVLVILIALITVIGLKLQRGRAA